MIIEYKSGFLIKSLMKVNIWNWISQQIPKTEKTLKPGVRPNITFKVNLQASVAKITTMKGFFFQNNSHQIGINNYLWLSGSDSNSGSIPQNTKDKKWM